MKKNLPILFVSLCNLVSISQNNPININKNIILPKDTIETNKLVSSFNDLLIAIKKPNELNKFVWNKENAETYILLDEMNGIEKSERNIDAVFFKPYLTNIVKLNETEYYTQLSYIGLKENIPILKASFELIAHKENEQYKFSSALIRNSFSWKLKKT